MRTIIEVQFIPSKNNDVIVVAQFDDLLEKEIFKYNTKEVTFNRRDLVGLTEEESHILLTNKYAHYTTTINILNT